MADYNVKLLSKKEIAEGTMEFTLEKPEGFDYRAGQFGDIVLPSPEGEENSSNKHGFSFVSAPFEENLKMATRMRDTPFKNAIRETPDGTTVKLIATFGDFTLQKNEKVPAVFVIGGIGVTPVRSMIAQATHDKTGHKITLLHANRTPELAPFTEDFRNLAAENPNFTFVPVYTQGASDAPDAEHGHIDADMIKRHVPDIAGARYYLSGPEGMVKAMRKLLLEIGADEDNVRTEEFDGY